MLEAPRALLDERRAKGRDRSDEMGEGELHMVPPSSFERQRLGSELRVLEPATRRAELFAGRDGRMVAVVPVVVQALGVRAGTVDGKLRPTR